MQVKIIILKPRAMNYRHLGYTNFLATIHRQLFVSGKPPLDSDLPWWLKPTRQPVIETPKETT
jgi:hypothetical protein